MAHSQRKIKFATMETKELDEKYCSAAETIFLNTE